MARRLTSLSLALVMAALGVVMLAGTVAANHFGTFTTGLSGAEEAPGPGETREGALGLFAGAAGALGR